jgi:Sulfatase
VGNREADRAGRRLARSGAELLALTGLAITQPLLDVFGRAPDLFIHREASRFEIVAFALLVAVLPALVLLAIEVAVRALSPRAGAWIHLAFVGGLAILFGLEFLKQADVTSQARLIGLALAGGAVAVAAYRRWALVRLWLAYLAVAPVLFVALFLTTSRTADLLASQEVAAAELPPATNPADVVVLQFDEWPLQTIVNRAGEIDPELYPNLAALAGDGVWYRNATTAATFTNYAVPATLTGREPDGERSAIASEYPQNLFSLLAGQYDLDVIESLTHLCAPNLCDGDLIDQDGAPSPLEEGPTVVAPHGLGALLTDARQTYQSMVDPDPLATSPAATFDDAVLVVPDGSGNPTETDVPLAPTSLSLQSVEDLVSSIEQGQDPTLHFLHLLLPHTPYKFLPDGMRYSEDTGGLSAPLPQAPVGRGPERAAMDLEEQRLLLQASYTDALVGQIVDRLRDTGRYEDSVIVVTADHGIGLEPNGAIRAPVGDELEPRNYPDLTYVPLIIKAPGVGEPGTVSDANVSTIDVLPTIAGALGLELPWDVDGIDLGTDARSTSEKRVRVVTVADGAAGGRELSLGDVVTFDGDEVQAEVLARNVDTLLRRDNPAHRLYDVDDAGELVGLPVSRLDVIGDSGIEGTVTAADAYRDVDTSTGVVPSHFVADLTGAGDSGAVTVAVVVNGRVASVSPSWPTAGHDHHVESMLLPQLIDDGVNDIDLYVVGGIEGRRTLAPIHLAT